MFMQQMAPDIFVRILREMGACRKKPAQPASGTLSWMTPSETLLRLCLGGFGKIFAKQRLLLAFVRFHGPIFETENPSKTCAPQGASPEGPCRLDGTLCLSRQWLLLMKMAMTTVVVAVAMMLTVTMTAMMLCAFANFRSVVNCAPSKDAHLHCLSIVSSMGGWLLVQCSFFLHICSVAFESHSKVACASCSARGQHLELTKLRSEAFRVVQRVQESSQQGVHGALGSLTEAMMTTVVLLMMRLVVVVVVVVLLLLLLLLLLAVSEGLRVDLMLLQSRSCFSNCYRPCP